MFKRIITGAALIAAVTVFFFLRKIHPALFEILICFISALGTFEVARAFGEKVRPLQKWTAVAFSAFFSPAFCLFGFTGAALVAVVALAVQLSYLVIFHGKTETVGACLAFAANCYPALLLVTMSAANYMEVYSTVALVTIFIVSPFSDTFAYFAGSIFKGKKLCPSISPKKTVSGAIGGLTGGVIGAMVVFLVFGVILSRAVPPWWFFIIAGAAGAILTEFGDLVESVIKREAGIKDMGRLLPGHGGIMDRIDGILFACPFIYLCFLTLAAF